MGFTTAAMSATCVAIVFVISYTSFSGRSQRATMYCCEATLDQHLETELAKRGNFARRETL